MARLGKVKWHGERFKDKLEAHVGRNIDAACIHGASTAKVLISTDGTARTKPGRGAGGRFTKAKLVYGANPSEPGEPPHVQTGRLRASIAWERVAMVGRIGTNLLYGRWLELGTRFMAARPYLRRMLAEQRANIARLICRPMR